MKKVYFSREGNKFKANLHCHTTYSDGVLTPEEVKKVYQEKGYQIVAYTDHNVMFDHCDLNDENFFAMIGSELDAYKPANTYEEQAAFHINFYPRKSGQTAIPCYDPSHIRHGEMVEELRRKQAYIGDCTKFNRTYDRIPEIIDAYVKAGYLVQINHPVWSLQRAKDYLDLQNVTLLEIYNHGNFVAGYDEFDTQLWDELLCSGVRWFATATDDNHNYAQLDSPWCDSFGGFTVIQANALTQEAVIEALEKGRFYASTGPLFQHIELEDGKLRIECSPVRKIIVTSGVRKAFAAYPNKGEETLTSAEFNLAPLVEGSYARVTLIDAEGNRAWSQPIFDYKD